MIDEFIKFSKEIFRLITLAISIIILTLFLFGIIGLKDMIINIVNLIVPIWSKIIMNWGMKTFLVFVVVLFIIWYFVLGHPKLDQ